MTYAELAYYVTKRLTDPGRLEGKEDPYAALAEELFETPTDPRVTLI